MIFLCFLFLRWCWKQVAGCSGGVSVHLVHVAAVPEQNGSFRRNALQSFNQSNTQQCQGTVILPKSVVGGLTAPLRALQRFEGGE